KSLKKAANDFPDCKNCRNMIILITDGVEACEGDPCAVSRALRKKGVTLKPFVIGLGLDEKLKSKFSCVGKFYDASNEKKFKHVMNVVITQALNTTSAQINLLNKNARPKETNVPITIYHKHSGHIVNNHVHSLSPMVDYKVVAHTIPPTSNDSVRLEPGIHNLIPIDAPQGFLEIKTKGSDDLLKNVSCIIRKDNEMKTLNVQKVEGGRSKYITGTYDIEILSLPRKKIENVRIDQSRTTTVTLDQPGIVNLNFSSTVIGKILKKEKGKLERVCTLKKNSTDMNYKLLPGNYKIVYRAKHAREIIFSKEKDFTIRSGKTTSLDL
ncbi:MAG: hypothetical protein ABEH43_00305, partial [Flavobacteriales bacterium]